MGSGAFTLVWTYDGDWLGPSPRNHESWLPVHKRVQPDSNRWPVDLQSTALPLSYAPACLIHFTLAVWYCWWYYVYPCNKLIIPHLPDLWFFWGWIRFQILVEFWHTSQYHRIGLQGHPRSLIPIWWLPEGPSALSVSLCKMYGRYYVSHTCKLFIPQPPIG